MDFWRVIEILNKHKWLIVISGIVGAVLMWFVAALIGSRWLAVVDFVMPEQPAVTANSTDNQPVTNDDARNMAVLFAAIVKSQSVTEPVLHSMDQTQLTPNLLKNIDFVATGPRMFQLQVTDPSPSRAKNLANSLAKQFTIVYHDLNTRQAQKAVQLLESQLSQANNELDNARRRYDTYRNRYNLIGNLSTNVDTAQTILRQALQKRDAAAVQLMDAQARLQRLQSMVAELPAISQTDVIALTPLAQQQQDLTKAEDNLAELRTRYTDSMPKVQQAIAERDAIQNRINEQMKHEGSRMQHDHNTALLSLESEIRDLKQQVAGYKAQVAALDADVNRSKLELVGYKGLDMPMALITSDISEKSDKKTSVQRRLNMAREALDVVERQNPITMMDEVNDFNPPVNTTSGRTIKLIVLGGLASIICCCSILILLNSVDRRLRTVRQAEGLLPAGIIAAIPQPLAGIEYGEMARVTELQPNSMHSEAYRFLGLHLLNGIQRPVRSIMVLAAKAEQGSTTTLTNLGITLAQAGKKVILVDANVRTAEIHTVFKVPNEYGFTDVLRNPTPESLVKAMHPTNIRNLTFITSGAFPENAWELFRSEQLQLLSRLLNEQADFVLYDTPSSLMFTDAMNLAPVVDAAILCVRALEALTGAEERLVRQLEQVNVAVLGSVLSDIPPSILESYPNYEHYYHPVTGRIVGNDRREIASPELTATGSGIIMNGHGSDYPKS